MSSQRRSTGSDISIGPHRKLANNRPEQRTAWLSRPCSFEGKARDQALPLAANIHLHGTSVWSDVFKAFIEIRRRLAVALS
jgi:hypothetical protein